MYMTLDHAPPKVANWTEGVGFVTKEMVKKRMPAPSIDTMITYCGPPAFCEMISKMLLEDLGYDESMIFKF